MNKSETFKDIVQRRKEELGLSFEKLGKLIGVGHGTIHNWVTWNKWKKSFLRNLCLALRIEILSPELIEERYVIEGWLREDDTDDCPEIGSSQEGDRDVVDQREGVATTVGTETWEMDVNLKIPSSTPVEEVERLLAAMLAAGGRRKSGRIVWRVVEP